jgi:YHS domain-containing protein
MKKIILLAAIALGVVTAVYFLFIKEPSFKTTDGFLVNVNNKAVIIEGYDAVAYFTDNKPVMGNAQFSTAYNGATYWFASEEHLSLFKNSPEKYAPQYGAFCGYAVSIGKLRPVDPTIFQIENGKLILQHTKEAYDLFNEDLKANVIKADEKWPGLVTAHSGKPIQYDKAAKPMAAVN